jgi:hypothetical protein
MIFDYSIEKSNLNNQKGFSSKLKKTVRKLFMYVGEVLMTGVNIFITVQ